MRNISLLSIGLLRTITRRTLKCIKLIVGVAIISILPISTLAQETHDEWLSSGIMAHDEGEYEKAIECYNKALKIEPSSCKAFYEIAYSYYALEDYKKAVKYLKKAEKAKKYRIDETMLYSMWGSILDDWGKLEEALKIYSKGVNLSNNHLLFYNRGVTYYRMSDIENAKNDFIKSLQQNCTHSNSIRLLADIREIEGHLAESFFLRAFYLLVTSPKHQFHSLVYDFMTEEKKKGDKTTIEIESDKNFATVIKKHNINTKLIFANPCDTIYDELFTKDYNIVRYRLVSMEQNIKEQGIDKIELDLCRKLYAPILIGIVEKGYEDIYAAIVTHETDEMSRLWIEANEQRIDEFYEWLNNYIKDIEL